MRVYCTCSITSGLYIVNWEYLDMVNDGNSMHLFIKLSKPISQRVMSMVDIQNLRLRVNYKSLRIYCSFRRYEMIMSIVDINS